MRAKELMIGDWGNIYVFSNENPKGKDLFPAKITSIFTPTASESSGDTIECMFTALDGTGGVGYASRPIETFLPIPLTAEILEKNGFSKQKWNDLATDFVFATDLKQSPQTVIQFSFYSKEIEGVKSLLKMWTKSKFGHGQNDVHLCGVYYVHELQHALRLCGIDKEIVL